MTAFAIAATAAAVLLLAAFVVELRRIRRLLVVERATRVVVEPQTITDAQASRMLRAVRNEQRRQP
ncbi:MAG: hypothetical protein ACRDG7_09995 [Candidatus Limnocylindria bacterium]